MGSSERVVPPDGNRAGAESAAAISDELGLEPLAVVVPDCPLTVPLRFGTDHPDVTCLEAQLIDAGVLVNSTPDEHFDEATDAAVRSFQEQNDLAVDGVVGSRTASLLGLWVGPHTLSSRPRHVLRVGP